ncbi:cTAGE family member 5 isoform X3 [Gadus macrocephalus]|uniref:cTAGE family member 5 isoform X3 n=1 Tax=Gadus macrocephalus TaxID=80720 RepID=UPI0028CBB0B6|nr:cTAGE family member 5 isoform X3 [Gadus macrocephalus]
MVIQWSGRGLHSAFVILLLFSPYMSCSLLSDYKICGDAECESLMSRVQATEDHRGKDCRFLSFNRGDTIFVYHKLTGRRQDLWAGSIDKQFGYFPKDTVKEEQVYATAEKVVQTQEFDFFCLDENGYPTDSSQLETDEDDANVDNDHQGNPNSEANHGSPDTKLKEDSMSQDQSRFNHGDALSENHREAEDSAGTLENMDPGDGSGDGHEPNEQGGSPSSSSSSSSWFGSTVTGLLGMQRGSEHAEIENTPEEEEEEAKAEEGDNSLAASVTQWLGYVEQGETDEATLAQDEEGTESGGTESAFTSTMNSWFGYGNERTENAEKSVKHEIEIVEEEERKETFRSRKFALDLESHQQEEELAVPGTFDWLGDSLSSTIGFGTTRQVSGQERKTDKEEVENNNVKPSPSHSWNDLGIGDVLGFGKTAGKMDSTVESEWKEKDIDVEKHAVLQSIETSPSQMIQDMREPTNIHNVDTCLSPPPSSLPQQLPGEKIIMTDYRVQTKAKVLVAGVNSEEDSVSNTIDFPQSREESPIETDLRDTLSLNVNSDIDDVSDSISMMTDNESEGANLDEVKALHIRLEKDPKTDPASDSFLSDLDNVLSLDQVDDYDDNEKGGGTKEADEDVSAQTKDGNDPDLTQYSLESENDEVSVEAVFDGKAAKHEEDTTETGILNPGVAPTNTAGDQISASTQFHDPMQQNQGNYMNSRNGEETVQATDDGLHLTFEAEELNSSHLEALSDSVARKTAETEMNKMNTHIISAATQVEQAVELRTDSALDQLSLKEAGKSKHTLSYSERQSEENKISLTSHDIHTGIVDGYPNVDTIDHPSGPPPMPGSPERSGVNTDVVHLDPFKIGAVPDENTPEEDEEEAKAEEGDNSLASSVTQSLGYGAQRGTDEAKLGQDKEGTERVETKTKVLVAGVNSEEDTLCNTSDLSLEQSREESPIETDLRNTLSLNVNSDIDDVSDSISMLLITDDESEAANLDEVKALQIRLKKDPKTDPSSDSFLSKLDNVLSQDQEDDYEHNEKGGETMEADENVSKQTKEGNYPDLRQYSLEADEGSVKAVFNGNGGKHEEDKTETGTLNPGVAPANSAGEQIFASTQFHDTSLTSHDIHTGIVDGFTKMDTIEQPSGPPPMAGSRERSCDNKDGEHLDHFKIGAVLDEEQPVTEAQIADGGDVLDSDNFHESVEPLVSLFENPKSTTVENTISDTVIKMEGKEMQERDEDTEIVEKLQMENTESLHLAVKNHSSWIRDNESKVRATESLKQDQIIMDEPYREEESDYAPTNEFQPDNIDQLYSGVATFPEPSINEKTESNHQSVITDQVTTIVEEGENVNSDNYDVSITEQSDSIVVNSDDISMISASHNDAVSSVQAVIVDSLKPDFPVEDKDTVRPESVGGAFGMFKNAFSYFSPTPSAENHNLKPIPDSSGIGKTFKPEGSLTSEQVTHFIADTTLGKGVVPDIPVSSNTLQPPLQEHSQHPAPEVPIKEGTATAPTKPKALQGYFSVEETALLTELFGRHKLQWVDFILRNPESTGEDMGNDRSLLLDMESLLLYHVGQLAQRQDNTEQTGELTGLKKLQILLARVKEILNIGQSEVVNTNNEDDASCISTPCLSTENDKQTAMGKPRKTRGSSESVSEKTPTRPGVIRQLMDFVHHSTKDVCLQLLAVNELLRTLIVQVVLVLPDDIRPGPDLYGVPWEPVIITSLVGLVTIWMFSCRFCNSVKSRMYRGKERRVAMHIADLLNDKCKVLEAVSKVQTEYDELEGVLRDSGVLAQTEKAEQLELQFSQLESSNQDLERDLEFLKEQLKIHGEHRVQQERTIAELEESIKASEKETKELQAQEEEAVTTLKIYNMNSERLQRNLESAEEENILLQESNTQLSEQMEGWVERVSELEDEMRRCEAAHTGMQQDVDTKDHRIKYLTDRLLSMKALDSDLEQNDEGERDESNGDEKERHLQKVQKLIYAAKLNADLKSMDEDKDRTFAKLNDEIQAKEELQQGIKGLEEERTTLQTQAEHYTEQVQRLQQKLLIMTEMYQENELKLHRLLTVEEKERLQKEEKLNKADKNISLAMEELDNYRQQAENMEEELGKTKQSYQTQISSHEKKAHNNWLAARSAERDLADIRRENTLLRQKYVTVFHRVCQ